MFDIELPEPAIVATLDDAGLLDAVAATSKLESAIQARRFSAIGELWERRKRAAAPEHEYFLIDTWEEVAAEIAAAVEVSPRGGRLASCGSRRHCVSGCPRW